MRLVYHPSYNISFFGIERLHPFDSRKYGRAWVELRKAFGRRLKPYHLAVPRPVSPEELLTIHTSEYLQKLKNSHYLATALELHILRWFHPWFIDWRVLRPMRRATLGSVIAAKAALEHGIAVNLSGGYHHAKPDQGEGFCIYSDIALIVRQLRSDQLLREDDRIAYIDLDAHQGNGVCHHFLTDKRFFIFDMYNPRIYPAYDTTARDRIDCDLPLPFQCRGDEYLDILQRRLPGFLDGIATSANIALAIYNAGTDVFAGDLLGGLHLSADDVLARDLFVAEELRRRNIPMVMLLSGGYSMISYQLVAATVKELMGSYGV